MAPYKPYESVHLNLVPIITNKQINEKENYKQESDLKVEKALYFTLFYG